MKDNSPQFEPIVPSDDQLGPAMLRLTEMQRRFVIGLSVWGGNATEAARWAGYSAVSEQSLRQTASKTLRLDYIKEAIKEEAWRRMDESALLAVSTVVRIASNSVDEKVALKAAEILMDRTGFHAKSEHLVVHEDRRTTQELIDFIKQRAGAHGLDANKLLGLTPTLALPVIEAEYAEVPDGRDGLEDLL